MTSQEFKQLFLPHHRVLYRVAFHLTGSQEDAEDLVQDLYLLLWTKREQIDEQRQTQAYLVTMIRNLHYSQRRRMQLAQPGLDNIAEPPDHDTPERQLLEGDSDSQVRKLIEQLPERERQVISLHLDEMDYRQMSSHTGLSPGNLRVIVMRTKQKLQQQIVKLNQSWKK